ncbi:MAG: type VI secretion system tip protein TssI/VgrG, partial [Fibrobacteria bacterium]
ASSEEENVTYDQMVGQLATLSVTGEDFATQHHGVVTEFNEYPDISENHGHASYLYEILIEPRVKLLSYTTQNRIFQKLSVKEIISQALTAHKLAVGTDFKFEAEKLDAVRDFTVQYNESDLNFVSRLLEEEGVFYYFNHEGDKEVLTLCNKIAHVKTITHTPEVRFEQESGLSHLAVDHITRMRRTQRMVTGKVTIKDYNFDNPQVNVIGRATRKGEGEHYQFSPHARTPADAEALAGILADTLSCGKIQLDGEGIVRAFRAGCRFKLIGNANAPFLGDYTLVRVTHYGNQREGFEGDKAELNYRNSFTCIPGDILFRPAKNSPRPRIHGVITARADGPEDKYAFLDEEGRYRAKLPFDLGDKKDGEASLPVRLSQPYAGGGYGTHFPMHAGNDLVLAFIDGNVDRPIALGSIPNPSTASPVNNANKSESIIKTASGHIIRMDDKEDKTAIGIITKGQHSLSMNDDADAQEIRFTSTDKNEMVFDDKQKNIRLLTPDGAHLIKLDYDKQVLSAETKYGHKLTMDDKAKKIGLQTKDGSIIMIDDDRKMISVQDGKGKHVFQIDIGGSKISLTTDGDMEFKAKGKLDVEAKEISMTAKTGKINMKASAGDVMIDGMNVNVKGKQKVALEGTAEASLKGAQTKIEGTATLDMSSKGQTKVGGLQVSVEGQAMAEVKAAMVMIN